MFFHNIKIAWRNLLKYKWQTSVSILSLTVGMVCFALSALWLRYETQYDTWWPEHDDVFLVQYADASGYYMEAGLSNQLSYPDAGRLAEAHPQIELLSRMMRSVGAFKVSPEAEDSFNGSSLEIDNNVQEMLGIKVLDGRKQLNLKYEEVALTRSMAENLFHGKNAVGQKVWFDYYGEQYYVTVVAIVEDPQRPTSFPYDFLKGIDLKLYDTTVNIAMTTFARVKPENVAALKKALEHEEATMCHETYDAETGEKIANTITEQHSYNLLPLSQLREHTDFVQKEVEQNHLQLFFVLGIIVICCALFNYFTMLVTRIRIRQRELALRYVHGATMGNLIALVATELIIILTISTLIATGIVSLTIEDFKDVCCIFGEPDWFFIAWFLVFALAAALVSLLATALIVYVCCRKQLQQALDKRKQPNGRSLLGGVRGGLMILQLAVSLATVFCSVMMMNQIQFLLHSPNMGFNKHNRGYIEFVRSIEDGKNSTYVKRLEDELKQWPELEQFLVGYTYPISRGFQSTCEIAMEDGKTHTLLSVQADEHYYRFMEMQMVDGEFISSKDDESLVCINETAAKLLGEQGKVGGQYRSTDEYDKHVYTIKGIVKDLSYMSPTTPTQAMAFVHTSELDFDYWFVVDFPIQWKEGTDVWKLQQKLEEKTKQKLYGDDKNISLMLINSESIYEEYLKSEQTLCHLLMLVTAICVLIAIFGMFSAISLACERRRKEVALRKIHGAGTWDIYRLFLREYTYMLIIGGIIAFPVGYYIMHQWQMQYVKQAPIPLWLYPAILVAMALLILVTIFWQIRKVAKVEAEVVLKE